MDTKPEDILNEMCRKGKCISVSLEITNTKKAAVLMGTLYYPNDEKVGVRVNSWGHFNEIQAYTNKDNAVKLLQQKHQKEMSELLNTELQSFLN